MIKYLKIKRTANGKKGSVIQEKAISSKKPILVCGKAASGKTKWLRRMVINAPQIWLKITEPVISMEANETIAEWREQPQIKNWWQKNNPESEWKKLPNPDKNKALLQYVSQNWTVVFVDNVERLSGRKLDLMKEILMQCKSKVWVCSTIAENRINPYLRSFITKSNPQTFTLNSPVSYDATNAVTVTLCAVFMMIGWYPAAIALGGMRMLGKGMFSTKQQ